MAVSQYLAQKLLNHITNNGAYTPPATLYLALYSVIPTATTSGTEIATGAGYTRQVITCGAASGEQTTNTNTILFGPNTSSGWGTIVAGAIVDSPTVGAGNVLAFANLGSSRTLNIGDRLELDPGTVTITLS